MTAGRIRVVHVDVAGGDLAVAATAGPAFVVLWWKTLALGAVTLAAEDLPCPDARLRDLAAGFVADQLIARAARFAPPPYAGPDGVAVQAVRLAPALGPADLAGELDAIALVPPRLGEQLSVVVCTRDRPDSLKRCLASLAELDPAPGEILVVDNSASGSARTVCTAQPGVNYLHEPRPGLSIARNAGVRAAGRALIAFIDDDVQLHPGWVGALVGAFADSEAEAVTGLVLPARLDRAGLVVLGDAPGSLAGPFTPVIFDQRFFAEAGDRCPPVWRIGSGANMAFRRSVFDRIDLFDERLGRGAAGGAEDSEFWYRILATGGSCLFEPRAVVFHHHHGDGTRLLSRVKARMRGHVAALVVQADRFARPATLARVYRQLPLQLIRKALARLTARSQAPRGLLRAEIRGWLEGLAYARDRAWRRRTEEWPGEGSPYA